MFLMPMVAWTPSDAAREFAQDLRDAIDATMTRHQAALAMGLVRRDGVTPNEAELSAQLNCQKPLNVFRLTAITDVAFWDELQARIAERRGGMYLTAGFVMLLHGAATIGGKKMARMDAQKVRKLA